MPWPRPALQILIAWLLFAAVTLLWGHAALDTDSAMRLVELRDLLAGQSWFDTAQHRMNVPYGLPMHWSRLLDAPLALLLRAAGEQAMLYAWPLLLFGMVLAALAGLAERAGGRAAVPLVLALTLAAVFLENMFSPGSIDHHTLQLVLMLWAMIAVIDRRPLLLASLLALALGVGLETAPYVALGMLAPLWWLRDDPARTRRFGVALSALSLLLLFSTTAARYRFAPACDTYSLFYAVLLFAGGAGLALVSLLPRKIIGLCLLAALLVGLAVLIDPACLHGPYGGMDARLKAIFLARINEAHPMWEFYHLAPSEWLAGFGYGACAFAAAWWMPRGPRPAMRASARLVILGFAAMALAVACWQIRAVPFLVAFALPGLAAALARILKRRGVVVFAACALLLNQVTFAVAGVMLEGAAAHEARLRLFKAQVACAAPENIALLNAQPPGRVAAFVDQGPAILASTGDSVIAGPYHRDAAGILDSYRIFTGFDGHAMLKARGIRYLMTCKAAPDWDYYRAANPAGLIALLAEGHKPAWLTPLAAKGDVVLYRVD